MTSCSDRFQCTGNFDLFVNKSTVLAKLLNESIYHQTVGDRVKTPLFSIGILGLVVNTAMFGLLVFLLYDKKLPWKKYTLVANIALCDAATALFIATATGRRVENIIQRNFLDVYHSGRAWYLPSWSAFFLLAFWCPMISYWLLCGFLVMAVYFPVQYQTRLNRKVVICTIALSYLIITVLSLLSVFAFNARPEYCNLPGYFTDFTGKQCVLAYQGNYKFSIFQLILLLIFTIGVAVLYGITARRLVNRSKMFMDTNSSLRNSQSYRSSLEVTRRFLVTIGPSILTYGLSVTFMVAQWIFLIAEADRVLKIRLEEFYLLKDDCNTQLEDQLALMVSGNNNLKWIKDFSFIAYLRLVLEPILHFAMNKTLRQAIVNHKAMASLSHFSERFQLQGRSSNVANS